MSIVKRQESALGAGAAVLREAPSPAEVFGRLAAPASSEAALGGVSGAVVVPVRTVNPSPYQTRQISDDTELEGLAGSIAIKGVLQPIIVRPSGTGASGEPIYELVCGERRLRAAKLAGMEFVPAVVRSLTDQETAELSIIENAQRENLNAIEEASAYQQLIEKFRLTQAEVAHVIGKNRATIANSLRLLHLDGRVIELLRQGALTAGHGRALLTIENRDVQYRLAKKAVLQDLSVRVLENLVSARNAPDDELSEEEEREAASLERQKAKIGNWLGIEKLALRSDAQGRKRLNLTFDTEAAWKRFLAKIRE